MDEIAENVPASEKIMAQILSSLKFTPDGLIPAISQQHDTGEILMMAWMNREAIKETLLTGQICYWSRSRQSLWRKGESSGQSQTLHEFRWDCDADTVLMMIDQKGVACHTGRKSCFHNALRNEKILKIIKPKVSSSKLYK